MAEPTKKETGEVTLYNRGIRTYHTSHGPLAPGKSITVPEKEAKSLLDYSDVVDMSKVTKAGNPQVEALKAENARLKQELEEARAEKGDKGKGK